MRQKWGCIVNIEEKNGILHLGSTAIVLKNVVTVTVVIRKHHFIVIDGIVSVNGTTVYTSGDVEEVEEVHNKILQHLEKCNG